VHFYRGAFERENRRWMLAGVRAAHALLSVGRTEDAFRLARELAVRFGYSPSAFFVLAEACEALSREGRVPALVDPSLSRSVTASGILAELYEQLDHDPSILPPLVSSKLSEGDEAGA